MRQGRLVRCLRWETLADRVCWVGLVAAFAQFLFGLLIVLLLVSSNIAGGVKPEEFDMFHHLVLIDEVSRCGSGGVMWGLQAGLSIGLPPILHFGSKFLKEKVVRSCLLGEKIICLAITE